MYYNNITTSATADTTATAAAADPATISTTPIIGWYLEKANNLALAFLGYYLNQNFQTVQHDNLHWVLHFHTGLCSRSHLLEKDQSESCISIISYSVELTNEAQNTFCTLYLWDITNFLLQ